MTKLSTVGKVLSKVSNTSYNILINGITKHIAIDNMSKTVINDNTVENVNDSASVSDVDSDDTGSIMSDYSDFDFDDPGGTVDAAVVAPNLQVPRTPVLGHPPHLNKKTHSG